MAVKEKSRAVKLEIASHLNKVPRAKILPNENIPPIFKADKMDQGGNWGWSQFPSDYIQKLLFRIFECQKMTWQELRQTGSHSVSLSLIVNEARKRLEHLELDDIEELYSLRLCGKERVWGIKEGGLLWILWWDPNHEICPCNKKHT